MDLISEAKISNIAIRTGFNTIFQEKDYFLTVLLYLIKDIDGIYFKGGTALNKIVFNHTRLSEDLDFTCTTGTKKAIKEIEEIVKANPKFFAKTELGNNYDKFVRLKVYYNGYFQKNEYINVDLNAHAKIRLKAQTRKVNHFYEEIPQFDVKMLNEKELIAEKIRALFQRKQPRDYFDAYQIISSNKKIDMALVKKKLRDAGLKFEINRIFKSANKVYSKWQEDISNFTNTPIEYKTVIKEIAKKFKYKESKGKKKKNKSSAT